MKKLIVNTRHTTHEFVDTESVTFSYELRGSVLAIYHEEGVSDVIEASERRLDAYFGDWVSFFVDE